MGGAAYLVYLGVKLWRAPVSANGIPAAPPAPPWKIFLHAYGVTALNPKGIVFFVAFLPQFVDRGGDVAWQLLILGSSFVVIATVNALAYALLAAGAPRGSPAVRAAGGQSHRRRPAGRGGAADRALGPAGLTAFAVPFLIQSASRCTQREANRRPAVHNGSPSALLRAGPPGCCITRR